MSARILLVEDEENIREVLSKYLQREGFEVIALPDGRTVDERLDRETIDLVILDLMLPGTDGIEICRRIRQKSSIPVLMLTARGEVEDRILGFGVGADDYVTKPFVPLEIVLRVKAILRRSESVARTSETGGGKSFLTFGNLTLDRTSRRVTVSGEIVEMTVKEFDLLWTLAEHAGQVLSRSQLLSRVWQYEDVGDSSTVTVHIRKLREKIEADPSNPKRIRTVWGLGYRFEKDVPS